MEFSYSVKQKASQYLYSEAGKHILGAIETLCESFGSYSITVTSKLVQDHAEYENSTILRWLKRLKKDKIIELSMTNGSKFYTIGLLTEYANKHTNLGQTYDSTYHSTYDSTYSPTLVPDPVLYSIMLCKEQPQTTAEETGKNFSPSGEEIRIENYPSNSNQNPDEDKKSLKEFEKDKPMTDQILDLCRIYSSSGNKFKGKRFKGKSALSLSKDFGEQLEKIIQSFGEDLTREGMRRFMDDPYWRSHELPLFAFLKTPERWIPETLQDEPEGDEGVPQASEGVSMAPAASWAAKTGTAVREVPSIPVVNTPNRERLRVMRRNEACSIFQAVGDEASIRELSAGFDSKTDLEVESYFTAAVAAFEKKMKRKPPVSSSALV